MRSVTDTNETPEGNLPWYVIYFHESTSVRLNVIICEHTYFFRSYAKFLISLNPLYEKLYYCTTKRKAVLLYHEKFLLGVLYHTRHRPSHWEHPEMQFDSEENSQISNQIKCITSSSPILCVHCVFNACSLRTSIDSISTSSLKDPCAR